ncbi:hypothetical protein Q8A73_012038 [Channa argus]|nr:hypothetical protein Q8A73_012038 [Channa argus]
MSMKRPSHLISRENSNSGASAGPQAFLQQYGLFMWGKAVNGVWSLAAFPDGCYKPSGGAVTLEGQTQGARGSWAHWLSLPFLCPTKVSISSTETERPRLQSGKLEESGELVMSHTQVRTGPPQTDSSSIK